MKITTVFGALKTPGSHLRDEQRENPWYFYEQCFTPFTREELVAQLRKARRGYKFKAPKKR